MLDGLQKVLGNDAGWNEQGSWSQVGWAKQRQEGHHSLPGKNMIAFNFLSGSSLSNDMAKSTITRYRRSWRGLLESCQSVRHWACEDLAGSPSSSLTRSKTWVIYIIPLFQKNWNFDFLFKPAFVRKQSEMKLLSLCRTSSQPGKKRNPEHEDVEAQSAKEIVLFFLLFRTVYLGIRGPDSTHHHVLCSFSNRLRVMLARKPAKTYISLAQVWPPLQY